MDVDADQPCASITNYKGTKISVLGSNISREALTNEIIIKVALQRHRSTSYKFNGPRYYSSLLTSSTTERTPVLISYLSPTI